MGQNRESVPYYSQDFVQQGSEEAQRLAPLPYRRFRPPRGLISAEFASLPRVLPAALRWPSVWMWAWMVVCLCMLALAMRWRLVQGVPHLSPEGRCYVTFLKTMNGSGAINKTRQRKWKPKWLRIVAALQFDQGGSEAAGRVRSSKITQ